MALITVLTHDPAVLAAVPAPSAGARSVASTRSWERLLWLVRERPVTEVVVDSGALPVDRDPDAALGDLSRRFPSLGTILIARPDLDPLTLFRLGRAGISDLVLLPLDDLLRGIQQAMVRSSAGNTTSYVGRVVGRRLPLPGSHVLRSALEGALSGWAADDLAAQSGWTRAHLSVRLRENGLPSAGHLLIWAKLIHAGRWLGDPGRSAESISRQLEYSDGAAFRRALRNYVGGTPNSLRSERPFRLVLGRFLDVCGLGDSLGDGRSVA
ncbi:MAG: hypothetical protein O2958_09050 [Gemmatimonadetes bacterium]|nr:hypothetical protein [Gemmatimonadota bacterium]MDA1104705.1 hypothetical protein [Gemmatimonadota bacterium]